MPLQANQLSVKQSADTAELIAAALFDTIATLPRSTGMEKTIVRQLTKHAHELLSLHDLKAIEVMPEGDRGVNTPPGYDSPHVEG